MVYTGRPQGTDTVFVQIVAAATINFSLAWVRLLIEGRLLFESGFY